MSWLLLAPVVVGTGVALYALYFLYVVESTEGCPHEWTSRHEDPTAIVCDICRLRRLR